MGRFKNIWGSNIYYYITTLSLFHFFRNNQHSEKWSVSFKNFFRKCECIGFRKDFLETLCECINLGF